MPIRPASRVGAGAAGAEPLDGLRRERDLRHEDDGLAPEAHRLLQRAEVDLGLAAPRDAEQEEDPEPPRVERRGHRRDRRLLLAGRLRRLGPRRRGAEREGVGVRLDALAEDSPEARVRRQSIELPGELLFGPDVVVVQERDEVAGGRSQAVLRAALTPRPSLRS